MSETIEYRHICGYPLEGAQTTDRASLTDAEQLALRQAATVLQRARSGRSGD